MGIPKFFRYISERYPLTSQLIQENKIPEFDNLYVDFNGIIHNCSHPNDEDAHFRLSEEQIFTAIFTYVDHLFSKIKPKKLFFMAVDGVAPRAKMNQQRSRRFRTAREAQETREKAERRGEKLPDEKAFDSNCITPGTPFMARLSEQLKYFVNKKITEDANWAGVEVVLSGHEVPGEGEHKIMEYIRLSKAQPDYNPNTRHCLYGLDADLIMLGLLSHDPHFCLLREEVKFGPAARKKTTSLQTQTFFLLHLCLLREYLDLEFRSVAASLPFPYSLERIIDDFVLLAVFVGNDFLPHLPDLHIHENALERLFDIYKRVLPSAGGYINNSGTIDVRRLQMVLDGLKEGELEVFYKETGDRNWMKSKKQNPAPAPSRKQIQLNQKQKSMLLSVRKAVLDHRNRDHGDPASPIRFVNDLAAGDRRFVTTLAAELNLSIAWDEFHDEERNVVTLYFPSRAPQSVGQGDGDDSQWEDTDDSDDIDEQESNVAVDRVLNRYMQAQTLDEEGGEDFDAREAKRLKQSVDEWKRNYYKEKLEISYDDRKAVHGVVYRWIEGLQWVMFYYYSGVASWGWYYDYHYSPRISDFEGVDKMTFNFELGTPFKPFQQLMGVLPEASKDHIPMAYQDLMYSPDSPILDFYPKAFDLDLNGKKQDWEAVVKIPFLDQKRLLKAMSERDHRLTAEERQRNSFGDSTRFVLNPNQDTVYPSSLPGFFPIIAHSRCRMDAFHLPTLDGLHLVEGLCDGVFLGSAALAGFPSLATIPHTGRLEHHHVNVFQSESKNQSMVIDINNGKHEGKTTEAIAAQVVGKRTFLGWPFLTEGLVVAVSDEMFRHEMRPFGNRGQSRLSGMPHNQFETSKWRNVASKIENVYSKRYAVETGHIQHLLHVRPLKGLIRTDTGAFVKEYEDAEKEVEQALQLGLEEVISEDPRFLEREAPPLAEEFPEGSRIIFLGEHAYGVAALVSAASENTLSIIISFTPSENAENEKFTAIVKNQMPARYFPSYDAANHLRISGFVLAKITSSLMVLSSDGSKTNLGLSLKFEAKGLKVMDYSRKDGRSWEFSDKAVALIGEYKTKYPELFYALNNRGDDMLRGSDIFRGGNADATIKEIKAWLKQKGVHDFEPVPLNVDQLKKDAVKEIEQLADSIYAVKSQNPYKKAKVQGIPRQAVLKPAHSVYRLQNQVFALGDRVIMVQDAGVVPLAVKGVVVGLNVGTIDVIWDVPFISGTTLGGRCSEYRGSTVTLNSCLNLTHRQYVSSTKPPPPVPSSNPSSNRQNSAPGLRGTGHTTRGGFNSTTPVIMTNPNRHASGRGGAIVSQPRGPAPIVARDEAQSFESAVSNGPQVLAPQPPPSHLESLMNTLTIGNPHSSDPSASRSSGSSRRPFNRERTSNDSMRGGRGGTQQHRSPSNSQPDRGRGGFNNTNAQQPPQQDSQRGQRGYVNSRARGDRGRGRGRGRGSRGQGESHNANTSSVSVTAPS